MSSDGGADNKIEPEERGDNGDAPCLAAPDLMLEKLTFPDDLTVSSDADIEEHWQLVNQRKIYRNSVRVEQVLISKIEKLTAENKKLSSSLKKEQQEKREILERAMRLEEENAKLSSCQAKRHAAEEQLGKLEMESAGQSATKKAKC